MKLLCHKMPQPLQEVLRTFLSSLHLESDPDPGLGSEDPTALNLKPVLQNRSNVNPRSRVPLQALSGCSPTKPVTHYVHVNKNKAGLAELKQERSGTQWGRYRAICIRCVSDFFSYMR
ncbi:hypothetical protein AMECASPLE_006146 [Ameca splendens]|uniref:Uncharacterized protein n=1 Tax=Ameca splendens TaxID=208324 RepID=A0ABV0ZK93_9TELE